MASEPSTLPPVRSRNEIPLWRDERVLRIVAQVISAVAIVALLYWATSNVLTAANQRGMSMNLRFLNDSAGFPIGETAIPYQPSDTFAYAFWVGILGTLKISIVGIVFATLLGTFVGVARLSSNWLVSKLALAFIEIHRNIPLLVLLFLWYRGVFTKLPSVRESITWPGPVYINQRGLFIAWPRMNPEGQIFVILVVIGIFLAVAAWTWLHRQRINTGRDTHPGLASLAVLVVFTLAGWLMAGSRAFHLDVPALQGFNFSGGLHLSPEFTALLIGLVTYTAAFIAEVVRAGIQAVSHGQQEASRALGLTYLQTLNLVVLPQALRVIIPPLISQYLNLIKNSSLAFFIGYPELFFIGKTTINQAGRALQVILLVMALYLVISLVTSALMNWYNSRIQFAER